MRGLGGVRRRVDSLARLIGWRVERTYWCARAWLHGFRLGHVTFVGVTGSAGKTTTKDLAAAVLSEYGACQSSMRSYNGPVGVAKTLLSVRARSRYCVVEVSGGRPGDMDWPLRLFRPDIAVLTLVEREHVKSALSLDRVAGEKRRLVDALSEGGCAVLNIDDPRVRAIGESVDRQVIWVGWHPEATVRVVSVCSCWPEPLELEIEYAGRRYRIKTGLHGEHLALSVAMALGVGVAAGVTIEQGARALAAVEAPEGRMQVMRSPDGVNFVRDDWKAPYWSLDAPLVFMDKARAARKVVVIGTLSDYSLSASKLYPKVARRACEVADLVVFVGAHAPRALKYSPERADMLKAFTEPAQAAAFLAGQLRSGDLVLLKGTNRTDHLVRFFYDRRRPVQCWSSSCRRTEFCTRCPRLHLEPAMDTSRAVATIALDQDDYRMGGAHGCQLCVLGLGNPQVAHAGTCHNVGAEVLDRLLAQAGGVWRSGRWHARATMNIGGLRVALVKPLVAMNRSGEVVRRFLQANALRPDQCVLVHDDLDLPLGQVRLKASGGDAGHRGVRSVITQIGDAGFYRIRIGVRDKGERRAARELVHQSLSNVGQLEREVMQSITHIGREAQAGNHESMSAQ